MMIKSNKKGNVITHVCVHVCEIEKGSISTRLNNVVINPRAPTNCLYLFLSRTRLLARQLTEWEIF